MNTWRGAFIWLLKLPGTIFALGMVAGILLDHWWY